ncbi:MAG: hypothetical protein ACOC46_03315 [Pirellulales bacterium]
MRRVIVAAAVASVLSVLGFAGPLAGQQEAPKDKPAAKAKAKAKAKRNPFRRLPNYFGQIGLSDEQREEIYAIQAEYGPKIRELQQKIAALRDHRDEAARAVLTDAQREQLDELIKAARQRRRGASQEDDSSAGASRNGGRAKEE